MAIHEDLPGIEIKVCVDDIRLEEYDDEEEQSVQPTEAGSVKKVSRYIESLADQEFTIKYWVRHPFELDYPMLGVDVLMDGKRVVQKVLRKGRIDGDHAHTIKGVTDTDQQSGRTVFRPFRFSEVETTLNDDAYTRVEDDMKRMAKVGSISVQLWRVGEGKQVAYSGLKAEELSTAEVHEKALKGEPKYHGVSYGDAKPIKPLAMIWRAANMDKDPIAEFTFKYRSALALKQLLIIERTPELEEASTPEAAREVDLDRLDEEQRRQVEAFARNLLQPGSSQRTKIKRERSDDSPFGARKKSKNAEEIEVIDLTAD